MTTKFWCRTCAAYDASPCGNVGHLSESMRLVGRKWISHQPRRLVIAVPPANNRGSIEWVPCDEYGARLQETEELRKP